MTPILVDTSVWIRFLAGRDEVAGPWRWMNERVRIWMATLVVIGCSPQARVGEDAPKDPPPFTRIEFATEARQHTRYEVSFAIDRELDNPDDPREVELTGEFTGPDSVVSIPAFLYQGQTRHTDAAGDTYTPEGTPTWRVRFAPSEPGTWSFRLRLNDWAAPPVESAARTFVVADSPSHGFVRQAPDDPEYFIYDDGTPFFGIGENVAWDLTSLFEARSAKLARVGGNLVRIWMPVFAGYDLEALHGVGRYDAVAAFKLDKLFEAAEQNGIALILSLNDHGEFSQWVDANYANSPYRAANGGPLPDDDPSAVWTDALARASLRRLFRYLIARYGYSTALHSWELWNEMEWVGKAEGDFAAHQLQAAQWHEEMAALFRAHDPYHHLLTTALTHPFELGAEIYAPVDYAQVHLYLPTVPPTDVALATTTAIQTARAWAGRPVVMTEFGLKVADDVSAADQAEAYRRSSHEAIWASLMAKSAAGSLPWSWHIMENADLYALLKGASAFVAGEPLHALQLVPRTLDVKSVRVSDVVVPVHVRAAFDRFDVASPAAVFAIAAHGEVTPEPSSLHRYLFGSVTPAKRNPPTFRVNLRGAGAFTVEVASVSAFGAAKLTVLLDGAQTSVTDTAVTAGSIVRIDVPEGVHAIHVDSTGDDWIEIGAYVLEAPQPAVRGWALASAQYVLGWLQNRHGTFALERIGVVPEVIPDAVVTLSDVIDGEWEVEWWNTESGELESRADVVASAWGLVLAAPPFVFDLAFKARRQ